MDEERVKEIRFKASSYSWKHGGSDLVRFIFELLDERILLREEKSHLNDLYEAQTLRRTEAEVKNEKLREKVKLGAEIIEAKDKHRAELEDDNERLRDQQRRLVVVINAYGEDEGYTPRRVADVWQSLLDDKIEGLKD
jgi:hypothetical protein